MFLDIISNHLYRALSMRTVAFLSVYVCSYTEMRANLYCWQLFDADDESFAIAAAIYSFTLSLAFCERQGERNVFEIV